MRVRVRRRRRRRRRLPVAAPLPAGGHACACCARTHKYTHGCRTRAHAHALGTRSSSTLWECDQDSHGRPVTRCRAAPPRAAPCRHFPSTSAARIKGAVPLAGAVIPTHADNPTGGLVPTLRSPPDIHDAPRLIFCSVRSRYYVCFYIYYYIFRLRRICAPPPNSDRRTGYRCT